MGDGQGEYEKERTEGKKWVLKKSAEEVMSNRNNIYLGFYGLLGRRW